MTLRTIAATLILVVVAVAIASPVGGAPPPCKGPNQNDPGCPGGDPDPDPDPLLTPCDEESPVCVASVGKFHRQPAQDYALGRGGSYTELSSSEFGNVLSSLQEGAPATALCDAFDVLVIEWAAPKIKRFNWRRLLDYMACGGGVIYEDPNNVGALAPSVETTDIAIHSKDSPRTVTLDAQECFGGEVDLPLCAAPVPATPFEVINIHMVFGTGGDPRLVPFLRLAEGGDPDVLGLYGQFGAGRIVLTGPDNNFHGDAEVTPTDPNDQAAMDQYALLINEIAWVLGNP